jgi:CDGSH-type Zn-finger protein
MENKSHENLPFVAELTPIKIKVEPGKIYSWCTCGLSEKQPFCDGRHKDVEGMPFKSLKIEFEKEEEVWLCRCKHTKNPPYCDGSHKHITKS